MQVAVFGGKLILAFFRELPHAAFERLGEFLVLALEQRFDVDGGLLIFVLRAEALYARAEAAFEGILETRTRQLAVELDVAGAQLKGAVDEVQRISRERGRQERAILIRSIADDAARDHDLWERLVGQLKVRI